MHREQTQAMLAQGLENKFFVLGEQLENFLSLKQEGEQTDQLKQSFQDIQNLARWSQDKVVLASAPLLKHVSVPLLSSSQAAREKVLHCFYKLQWRMTDGARTALRKALLQRIELLLSINTPIIKIKQLKCAQHFLGSLARMPNALSISEPASSDDLVGEIEGLLQMRSALQAESVVSEPGASYLLQEHKQTLLADICQLCATSDWTLSFYVKSTLKERCRKLVYLSAFSDDEGKQKHYKVLETLLINMHVVGRPFELEVLLHSIMAFMLNKSPARELTSVEPVIHFKPRDFDKSALASSANAEAQSELTEYCHALKSNLESTGAAETLAAETDAILVTDKMLLLSYKLTWVLQALGRQMPSTCCHCLYQVLEQYWQLKRPMPSSVVVLLAQNLHKIVLDQSEAEQAACLELMHEALAQWPELAEQAILVSITAQGGNLKSLPLRSLSEYLSTSFSTLLAAKQAWFMDLEKFWQHSLSLQYELRLLEQGAAAYKLLALEAFTTQLHDIYTLLELKLEDMVVPGELLWAAHQELLAMLDQSASWLPVVPKQDLVAALTQCLHGTDELIAQQAKSQLGKGQRIEARLHLTVFLRQISKLLGRSVRVTVKQEVIAVALETALYTALKELLRWMLLQTESDFDARGMQHKPQAVNIHIRISALNEESCSVQVVDDSSSQVPDTKQIQRLQKTTGFVMHQLKTEVIAGQGRRLSFNVLAAVSRH